MHTHAHTYQTTDVDVTLIHDAWYLTFQWLYLSNVFAEPELRKSLENSSQSYLKVDENYRVSSFLKLFEPSIDEVHLI